MATNDKDAPGTFRDLRRNQLEIYAKELQEHFQQERRLRRGLEASHRELEQRIREVTALNSLFQEHLRQRSAVVEAYAEVREGLQRISRETSALAERARSERLPDTGVSPDLNPDATVTILFSDIEGFTSMTEGLGDQRAQELLGVHNAIVRRQVQTYGGSEAKSMGDGFVVAFPTARDALQCAAGIQRVFAAYNAAHPDETL
ncbi:MAG: adenylate/guanylate cyclase domain-containing protein, partial [Dehalococcoidia bacterium]